MRFRITMLAALLMAGATYAQIPKEPKPAAERAPTADEEPALAAMEGLMAQPPERALPIIKKVLAGSQTPLVKQRALFVLSQIDSPEAREILAQTARSSDAAMKTLFKLALAGALAAVLVKWMRQWTVDGWDDLPTENPLRDAEPDVKEPLREEDLRVAQNASF